MDRIDAAFARKRVFEAAFLAMLAGPAIAQRAERPDVNVGDQWDFVLYYGTPAARPNRSWIITSVSSTAVEDTENGEQLLLTPDLNVQNSPRSRESNPNALRFPLEVGKRWQYTSDWVFKPLNSNGRLDVDVTVVRHERVIVPASPSETLCVRHSMTTRSIYAKQDEDEECRDSGPVGGAAVDPEGAD